VQRILNNEKGEEEMSISGEVAVELLKRMSSRVDLHEKDNTDKFWSYKLRSGIKSEFAFDPNTKTKLIIRFDRLPPNICGVDNVEDISSKNISTALKRVFSGGVHTAKYKALIRDEETFNNLIKELEA
jgi:hypothetical protein